MEESPAFRAVGWGSGATALLPGSLWRPVKKEVGGWGQESNGFEKKTIITGILFKKYLPAMLL